MLHVGQLVAQDALELLLVQELQDAVRHADHRVLGVPTRGEGVGGGLGGLVDAGLGHARRLAELGHHGVDAGRLGLRQLLGAVGGQDDLVGEPVGEEVDAQGDDETR